MQVEVAQGSERRQGALLQVRDAVVLQKQRLKVVGTRGLLHCGACPTPVACPIPLAYLSTLVTFHLTSEAHTIFSIAVVTCNPLLQSKTLQSHIVPTCVPGGIPGGTTRNRRAPHSTVAL